MKKKLICLFGGHLSPAQAVAEELSLHHPEVDVLFLGRKHTFTDHTETAVELSVMSNLATVSSIDPPRSLYPWNWIPFILAWMQVMFIFLKQRPSVVVSFGSYVALPGILAAIILRIPIVIHEQTRCVTGANLFAARFAKYVCITDNEVVAEVDKDKLKITGFPLRPSLFNQSLGAAFSIPPRVPIIFVTGGTSGAVSINELVFPIVSELVKSYVIIHQTGDISYSKALEIKQALPDHVRTKYIVERYLSSSSMNWIYRNASLFISRSGANTIFELASFHLNAIFIPLPWSKNQEQQALADWFVKHHSGIVCDQKTVTSDQLLSLIPVQAGIITQKVDTDHSLSGTIKLVSVILASSV